jgi:hypothetical protein
MECYSLIGAIVCFLALLFIVLAIYFYPGGSFLDNDLERFNFRGNTISDLGRKIANNGEPNFISRVFYTLGLASTSLLIFTFFIKMIFVFKEKKIIKWISGIGSIMGFVSSLAYFIIAFVPTDVYPLAHNKLIFSAAPFLFVTIFIYIFVFFFGKELTKLNIYSFLVLAIYAVALATAITVGSIKGGQINEIIRRSGHSIFIFISGIVFGLQFTGLYIYLRKNKLKKEEIIEITSEKELDTIS